MGKIRVVELKEEERLELESEYRTSSNHSYRQRCKLVLLKSEGRSAKEVGAILGMHRVTVNSWLDRFEAEGIAGLQIKPGRGRKPILNAATDTEKVRKAVKQERQRIKQAKILIEQELGKQMSEKTLKRFLKSLAAAIKE